MPDFEIIVVVDGPNPATEIVLATMDDARLHVVVNERPSGPGLARNRGAALARGAWLAFLDDDDEYLPDMLERMLAVADGRDVMLCARARVLLPGASYVWPIELYRPDLTVDDYLFDRRRLFRGTTYMSTSSTFLPRHVFAQTQYGTSRHNEDTTLALRVTKQAGIRLEMLPETLVVVHMEATPDSLGPNYEWRTVLAWAEASRPLLTRRAYSGFCLIHLGSQAARRRDWRAIPILLWHAFSRGSPRPMHLAAFAGFWLVPSGLRQRVRAWAQRASKTGTPSLADTGDDALPHARS